MATKSQYKPQKKVKSKDDDTKTKIDKKILLGALALVLFMVVTAINQTKRQVQMTGSEANKTKRPQIAGLDIPREVMERIQKLKSTSDRENVIKEWAATEGITFKYKKDGSYVAIRDGQEYVMREPDPDYVPSENDGDDDENDDSQFKEIYTDDGNNQPQDDETDNSQPNENNDRDDQN